MAPRPRDPTSLWPPPVLDRMLQSEELLLPPGTTPHFGELGARDIEERFFRYATTKLEIF